MLFNKEKITSRMSSIIFILIAIQVAQTLSAFTDVPRKLNKKLKNTIILSYLS